MTTVYTIGHSNHPIGVFTGLLRESGITALADVRSTPYSRRFPQFRKEALEVALKDAGVAYVWLGRELGARPESPDCYVDGRLEYGRIAAGDAFAAGLDRVMKGAARYRLALMCAEREPLDCHRTVLICRYLKKRAARIVHILADGSLENHSETEARLIDRMGLADGDLFAGDPLEAAYEKRSAEMTGR